MSGPGLTCDKFLDGRLRIWQPENGYRAGSDAVMLASAVAAQPGQSVLDVGCGVGVVSLCLAWRVNDLDLHGLEVQGDYVALARRNALDNGSALTVLEGDLHDLPEELRQERFDHVVTNPPFFDQGRHTAPDDDGRRVAHVGNGIPLGLWIRICLKRVAPKGSLTLIQRAEHLPEILSELHEKCGNIEVFPISARAGRPAGRVIVTCRPGMGGPSVLHAPVVMHDGENQDADRNNPTEFSNAILRNGMALQHCVMDAAG